MGYLLNFNIPQGPTGPTGPAGSDAYGGIYDDTSEVLDNVRTLTTVPLTETMPSLNVTYSNNSIIIGESGVYELNYQCNLAPSTSSTITLTLRNGGNVISQTTIISELNDNYDSLISGNCLLELTSGSAIDMAISTSDSSNIILASGVNSYIIVKKIN